MIPDKDDIYMKHTFGEHTGGGGYLHGFNLNREIIEYII